MLAANKRKEKWTLNPRGKAWSEDSNKFGQRMLEKMGWSRGKGLGAKEDGVTEHVKVSVKTDNTGIGFKENSESAWTETETQFSQLLKNLSGSNQENIDSKKVDSLVSRSESSRVRVHYKKFTSGKDLSKYSSKDLANIFGKTSLQNENNNDEIEKKEEIPETSRITRSTSKTIKKDSTNTLESENKKRKLHVENLENEFFNVETEMPIPKKKKKNKQNKTNKRGLENPAFDLSIATNEMPQSHFNIEINENKNSEYFSGLENPAFDLSIETNEMPQSHVNIETNEKKNLEHLNEKQTSKKANKKRKNNDEKVEINVNQLKDVSSKSNSKAQIINKLDKKGKKQKNKKSRQYKENNSNKKEHTLENVVGFDNPGLELSPNNLNNNNLQNLDCESGIDNPALEISVEQIPKNLTPIDDDRKFINEILGIKNTNYSHPTTSTDVENHSLNSISRMKVRKRRNAVCTEDQLPSELLEQNKNEQSDNNEMAHSNGEQLESKNLNYNKLKKKIKKVIKYKHHDKKELDALDVEEIRRYAKHTSLNPDYSSGETDHNDMISSEEPFQHKSDYFRTQMSEEEYKKRQKIIKSLSSVKVDENEIKKHKKRTKLKSKVNLENYPYRYVTKPLPEENDSSVTYVETNSFNIGVCEVEYTNPIEQKIKVLSLPYTTPKSALKKSSSKATPLKTVRINESLNVERYIVSESSSDEYFARSIEDCHVYIENTINEEILLRESDATGNYTNREYRQLALEQIQNDEEAVQFPGIDLQTVIENGYGKP